MQKKYETNNKYQTKSILKQNVNSKMETKQNVWLNEWKPNKN